MMISRNSPIFALLAFALVPSVAAIDYDFRRFEGWWEGLTASLSPVENTENVVLKCGATGDFLKATCDATFVTNNDQFCLLQNVNYPSSVITGKISLDQFDADTGATSGVYFDAQCCGADGCVAYPFDLFAEAFEITNINLGPRVMTTFKQLPGKNANNIRAIEVAFTPEADSDLPSALFPITDQYRNTAGGFKSLD